MRSVSSFLPLFLVGCVLEPGDGVLVTEPREVGAFTAIALASSADLDVAVTGTTAVEVTCDDNLIDDLLTEVVGDVLQIKSRDGVVLQPSEGCGVRVETASLHDLEVTGSGEVTVVDAGALASVTSEGSSDVDVAGIDTPRLEVVATGSGNTHLAGAAEALDVTLSGSGDVDAATLETVDVTLDSTGSGDLSLVATGTVSGRLSGSGDVEVAGGATVDVDSEGSGRVVER